MPSYARENTRGFLRYEGLEHYLAARERGKGVLIVTGHLGAWELSSYYHSLMGYPMSLVIRRLDNAKVDGLVNAIRCLHGNRVLHKDDFARGLLGAMRHGETVGILMDTNMTPPQICAVLRKAGVYGFRPGARGVEDGCSGVAGLHGVGRSRAEIRAALRRGDCGGFNGR